MFHITSFDNPLIKQIKRLHKRSERAQTQLTILEGERALSTAHTYLTFTKLLYTEAQADLAATLHAQEHICIPEKLMRSISTMSTPSGLLALVRIPEPPVQELQPGLVLADIQDPGNMGTLIRTAVACNTNAIVIINGCDPWSPKVMTAAAGMHGMITIYQWNIDELMAHKGALELAALVVRNGKDISIIDPTKTLLVVGNEAHGIDSILIEKCSRHITLAMPGPSESLNAAVAGSIAAYMAFVKK